MVRVAVLGAAGYAGGELMRLLLAHPNVEVTALTTRLEGELSLGDAHPVLRGRTNLRLQNLSPAQVAERADCVFSCLPHAASAESVKELLAAGRRVVDFSADYRLKSPAVYSKWYEHEHPEPERLPSAVYGLAELYRERIPSAQIVANPGCYPTSAILALAPLLKHKAVSPDGLIIDSKSGVSGAGRAPKQHLHFPECNENFSAYNVGVHRHTPEIDQVLSDQAGAETSVVFTPHLVPMDRGILTTAYATPTTPISDDEVMNLLRSHYEGEPFVRVVKGLPGTKDVATTNFCDITARVVRGRVVVISVLDNMIKGAAGQAVQNFNLMYGFAETTALLA